MSQLARAVRDYVDFCVHIGAPDSGWAMALLPTVAWQNHRIFVVRRDERVPIPTRKAKHGT